MKYELAKIIETDKETAVSAASDLSGRVLVFEKTENSDLVACPSAITSDFFAGLFSQNGRYWQTYEKFGLGVRPSVPYLYFFGGQMYFLKNLELECVFGAGRLKEYCVKGDGAELHTPISLDSLMLLLAYPFDFARLSAATSLLALNTPLYLNEFEKFRKESREFCETHKNDRKFDTSVFNGCIDGAMQSMEHSFFATLSYSLNLKFPESPAWEICDAEKLGELLSIPSQEKKIAAISEFGFYALDLYDIRAPRLAEDFSANPAAPAPKNPQMRMRENAKFCLGRYFFILRNQLLLLADEKGFEDLVFHMTRFEILQLAEGIDEKTLKDAAQKRKAKNSYLEKLGNSVFPVRFVFVYVNPNGFPYADKILRNFVHDKKNGRWMK